MRLPLKSLILAAALAYSGSGFAGQVNRALFTIGVDDREPVTIVESIDSSTHTSISFFTELSDMSGQTATHQWTYNDKVMFEKSFEVKSERWRVWTSKTLIPSWKGTWTVNVLNDDRAVLSTKSFEYQ